MTLTDAKIRALKPRAKPFKTADFDGLYITTRKSGSRLWHFKYRVDGKEKLLSFGAYPAVSLAQARKARDEARADLAAGVDPGIARQEAKRLRREASGNSFEKIAQAFITKSAKEGRAPATMAKTEWLIGMANAEFGREPISDPASQWTAARKGPAFFAYSDNYLIDTDHGVIVDVEATRSIRQAEVGSTKTMLNRVRAKFDLHPEWLVADTAYGSGPMLGWLVDRKIAPHIPVIDKAGRTDGTWSRADFEWDAENNQYICPEGEALKQFRRNYSDPTRGPTGKGVAKYRALKTTCQACPSKAKCCPNMDFRSITREEHEDARDVARAIRKTPQYKISSKLRKKVEMLFAHLKRILGLGRLRLRGPCGANDEFLLAATAQNLRKLAKIFPAPQQTPRA